MTVSTDIYECTHSLFVYLAGDDATSALSLDQQLLIGEAFENYVHAVTPGTEPLLELEPHGGLAGVLQQLETNLVWLNTNATSLAVQLDLNRALDLVREARRG